MLSDLGNSLRSTIGNLFTSQINDTTIETTIKQICSTLMHSNVSPKLVLNLRTKLRDSLTNIPSGLSKPKYISSKITEEICRLLDPETAPYQIKKKTSNVIVFVGLQGCGKTTSICKYANYYNKKGYKTGIVCADTFRAGAFDQVKQNALKIKVPFYGSSETDPVKVAKLGVDKFRKEKFEVILVDTSGRNTQEKELFMEMKEIMQEINPDNIVFVMDAGIGQSAEAQAKGFSEEVKVGSIILTKLDGTNKAGGALTSVAVTKCPIEFIGTGENMDDFESFDVKRFVNKLLGKGDVEGLFEKVSSLNIDEKEMMKKIERGEFYLKDFYDQFQQLMSLGPLSKVMEMMPGMGNMKVDDEGFKKMICVFDSMNKDELNSTGKCFENQSRIVRVAKGSGISIMMVNEMLNQFRTISGLMKKLGKVPGMNEFIGKDPSKMSITEKTKMKNQMRSMLPKGMFEQFSQFF